MSVEELSDEENNRIMFDEIESFDKRFVTDMNYKKNNGYPRVQLED